MDVDVAVSVADWTELDDRNPTDLSNSRQSEIAAFGTDKNDKLGFKTVGSSRCRGGGVHWTGKRRGRRLRVWGARTTFESTSNTRRESRYYEAQEETIHVISTINPAVFNVQ